MAATAHRLRAVLLDAHPQLDERVRRGWHSINHRDPDRRLPGTGRQVRALDLTTPDQVDAEVVGTYLDHAVALGAALRAR